MPILIPTLSTRRVSMGLLSALQLSHHSVVSILILLIFSYNFHDGAE